MSAKHKQWETEYASVFQDESVVEAYHFRPQYPTETFDFLMQLLEPIDRPWKILDAGCGTGYVARELAEKVDGIDAVDISEAMIRRGKVSPQGDSPKINWICSSMEEAPLEGPYNLIIAAASLHWMDWDVVLPRFASVLKNKGHLALVEDVTLPTPWETEARPVFSRYSMNKDFTPYDMKTIAADLETKGLFGKKGCRETKPIEFRQSIDAFIESAHARNGFSRDRMDQIEAAEFDTKLKDVLSKHCPDGQVAKQIKGRVIWGKPLKRA